jgi:hypothetical protein
VSGLISSLPLSTRDTVDTDTPHFRAISFIVTIAVTVRKKEPLRILERLLLEI